MSGAGKDRVNDTDKAIVDVKARQRKIKTYMKKMETQEQQATDKIKELLKAGQKQRAMIHLKQKKFITKEVEKAQGAMMMLQQTLAGIESAQADLEI